MPPYSCISVKTYCFLHLQDSEFGADWFDAAMSKSDDQHEPWQVPDLPRSAANDLSGSPTDLADTDMAGSRTAAASDVDAAQLWSSVRGRLLITAVTVSMLASIVVLVAWICLR